MASPSRDRPQVPEGYGTPETDEGLLEWARVEEHLVASMHYWMATTRADGRPHVVPRWGVWLDDSFWYDGAPSTRHVRNVEQNPACSLHLEDGAQAVIIDGESHMATPPGPTLGARISAAFGKYADKGYAPEPDAWDGPDSGGLRVFTPKLAMAWFDFPNDMTRFRF